MSRPNHPLRGTSRRMIHSPVCAITASNKRCSSIGLPLAPQSSHSPQVIKVQSRRDRSASPRRSLARALMRCCNGGSGGAPCSNKSVSRSASCLSRKGWSMASMMPSLSRLKRFNELLSLPDSSSSGLGLAGFIVKDTFQRWWH